MTSETLAEHTAAATQMLKELANQNRLMIFCCLGDEEMSVSQINEKVTLSQSALSQHLARLREAGFLSCRREGQTVFYRLSDTKVSQIIKTLRSIYCPES